MAGFSFSFHWGYLSRKAFSDPMKRLLQGSQLGLCLVRQRSAAAAALKDILNTELTSIKEAGTWKAERIITTKQGVEVGVQGQTKKMLNFCANNYLGLSSHPDVIKAGKDALDEYGAGLSSVRFICGTQNIHKNLEKKIAKFHGREDSILYASCFDANAGLFEVLLSPEDAVFSDELNHASIIDGVRLCKAKRYRYKHRNMKDLEEQLKAADAAGVRVKLIASDGVFSMDGSVAPLPGIVALAEKYGALTFIDECHATGFFGPSGRGTEEYYGLQGKVDIINSTLGKALGGAAGGYTTASAQLVELLRQRSRPYLFSNSLPPPVVACADKVLDMLMESNAFAERVHTNTVHFREKMKKAGFNILGDNHPICPVMLGDARLAGNFANEMLDLGIYVIGFSYPVVPQGKARIRVQISGAHSPQDIDRTVDAFIQVGKKLKVIS
ncbi:unnamed protein product [Darwinula stevensoni]|uniref:2-amino-3-ketobutyrate coenzyme A ligase, mitochondrial n=1 Tax=Darwinula stevensoni TaxID=69355 RepID=A0A7R9A2N7_9CRUS|nr:unnamed protein product [Darwinula stevensoni]CAG0879859.1 unnamed protein product [Darwinula stevensoni]